MCSTRTKNHGEPLHMPAKSENPRIPSPCNSAATPIPKKSGAPSAPHHTCQPSPGQIPHCHPPHPTQGILTENCMKSSPDHAAPPKYRHRAETAPWPPPATTPEAPQPPPPHPPHAPPHWYRAPPQTSSLPNNNSRSPYPTIIPTHMAQVNHSFRRNEFFALSYCLCL